MTSISVAARIWLKAVFLFGISIGFIATMTGDIFGLLLAALAFFFGFIIALPLLLPIFALVEISKRLSKYSIPARIAWLTFYLILLFYFYYELFANISGFNEFRSFFAYLIFFTIGVLLVAVLSTRKSLNKLYTQSK
jgi:hypothetical protein